MYHSSASRPSFPARSFLTFRSRAKSGADALFNWVYVVVSGRLLVLGLGVDLRVNENDFVCVDSRWEGSWQFFFVDRGMRDAPYLFLAMPLSPSCGHGKVSYVTSGSLAPGTTYMGRFPRCESFQPHDTTSGCDPRNQKKAFCPVQMRCWRKIWG